LWVAVRLTELLTPDRIVVPLQARDKEGVLRELVGRLLLGNGGQSDDVLAAVLERERQFPTGIGHGVAVPHGRMPAMAVLGIVAGTSPDPVRYETIDGQPVRLFFLLAGPEALAGASVKALSRISRLVRQEGLRARLLAARTPQEFHRTIAEAEGA
jgi:mannitol/fructose-specific phosphotransferase system IIA component (Ntr-type)